jgi:transposase-like protein
MDKAFSNLLNHIDKLTLTKKEQVYQWVKRYVDPSSSVGGRLINEMRETRFKDGFECLHCNSVHVVRFGKYNGRQRYRCKSCRKTFTDTTNTFCSALVKATNGLHLLIVCSKAILYENRLKS